MVWAHDGVPPGLVSSLSELIILPIIYVQVSLSLHLDPTRRWVSIMTFASTELGVMAHMGTLSTRTHLFLA